MRPRLHFTPPQGWMNDPHGICWTGSEYHLFYQHNPTAPEWTWAVEWGHAVSSDLMRWRQLPVALSPRDGEGCWSGATFVEDGRPTILYTSVSAHDLAHGRIALALPDADSIRWHRPSDSVVVDGAPDGVEASEFRDPFLVNNGARWTMVVGASTAAGRGLLLQYTSTDARVWTYDGVTFAGSESDPDGMWECPQLFRAGDDWVLIVSLAMEAPTTVMAAVGSYDGHTFTPRRWSRLMHDDIAYATSAFTDSAGRPCLLSWLRESPDHEPSSQEWSGALSLPMTVEVGPDDTVRLLPHPDVDSLRMGEPTVEAVLSEQAQVIAGAMSMSGLDIELVTDDDDEWFRLTLVHPSAEQAVLVLSCGAGGRDAASPTARVLDVTRPGHRPATIPIAGATIRVILDHGLVDIFAGDGAATVRLDVGEADLLMSGSAGVRVTTSRLAVTSAQV